MSRLLLKNTAFAISLFLLTPVRQDSTLFAPYSG